MEQILKQPVNLKRDVIFLLLSFAFSFNSFFAHNTFAQGGPPQLWLKQFGGNGDEIIANWVETSDGGYLIGASSSSLPSKNKTAPNKGGFDFWIVKIDKNGNKQWDKTFGGSSDETLTKIINAKDGNFLLGGTSYSGISGDKSGANRGDGDFWVVKISPTGTKIWDKTFGGASYDLLTQMIENSDGTITTGGYTASEISGDKTAFSRGRNDIWLVKINSNGSKIWDKAYGGVSEGYFGNEILNSLKSTSDGGYLLGGTSDSNKGFEKSQDPFISFANREDYWLIKTDGNGNRQWDKIYGGVNYDILEDLQILPNGAIMLVGSSASPVSGNKTVAPPLNSLGETPLHSWLVLLDAKGNKLKESYMLDLYSYTTAADGYYLMRREEANYYSTTLEKYNWADQKLWTKYITMDVQHFPTDPMITKSGELMIGHNAWVWSPVTSHYSDQDIFISKYDSKLYTPDPVNFYRAINFNSSASLTIDNLPYEGSKVTSNFTYTGKPYENQSIPLAPSTDSNRAKMIRSVIYSTRTTPSTFNIANVPNGNYEVFIYVWEDNRSTTYSIQLEGQDVLFNYESGPKGSWAKLGPFRTTIADGAINIKAYGGDANLSGVEIFKYTGTMPAARLVSAKETGVVKSGFNAYPTLIEDKLNLVWDGNTEGSAKITLMDFMGNVYLKEEKNLEGSTAIVNLPNDKLKSGVYLLKVILNGEEKVIRLYKN